MSTTTLEIAPMSPSSSAMSSPISPPQSPSSPDVTRCTPAPVATSTLESDYSKIKRPHSLVKRLQRISSSPPLSRLTRSTPSVYANNVTASSISLSPSPAPSMHSYPGMISRSGMQSSARGTSSLVRAMSQRKTTVKTESQWDRLPMEIQLQILSHIGPRILVRCSAVSKSWSRLCFDGQLWSIFETYTFYQDIPAQNLIGLINKTAPFIKYLSLRGCVQLCDQALEHAITSRLDNLDYLILSGCQLEKEAVDSILGLCSSITYLNLSGTASVSNYTLRLISKQFPGLEHLDISWCHNADTRGLRKIIKSCPNLRKLLAVDVGGWDDEEIMQALFERNSLDTLTLGSCDSLTDESFKVLMVGKEPEYDVLTGKPMVPVRRLQWLNLYHCQSLTSAGLRHGVHCLDNILSLQLARCHLITDAGIIDLIPTLPNLQYLDLEDLRELSNDSLIALSEAPCAGVLRMLGLSQCERLDDTGMVPLLRTCDQLVHLEVDNTQISDLTLAEAAAALKRRAEPTSDSSRVPQVGLRLNAYDCPVITWAGVREIVSRNAEVIVRRKDAVTHVNPSHLSAPTTLSASTGAGALAQAEEVECLFPTQIISLRCVYTYQEVVEEHTKRVMRGDFASANRLERKWAGAVIATWENVTTAPRRPRPRANRRTRQAWRAFRLDVHEDARPVHTVLQAAVAADANDETEEDTAAEAVVGGSRRRTRSGGCTVM